MSQETLSITRNEYELMNNLLLQLVDVDGLCEDVKDRIHDVVMNNPLDYVCDGEVIFDKDSMIDKALEYVFKRDYDSPVPTIFYETVPEKIDYSFFHTLEHEVYEIYRESKLDPYAYNGVSPKDFF